jgi:two-component system, NarL family, nitrate/nitrite response regulator NarL
MTRVFIVIGIRLYREGLVQLLGTQEGVTVVGAESDCRQAVARLEDAAPHVVLVETGMPNLDAMTEALAARSPNVPLVAMGISDSDSDVIACAEQGFAGYVTREGSVDELAAMLRGAASGELACSARTAATLMKRLGALAAEVRPATAMARLTRREREVAALMQEDLSNKEIAMRLRIEVATVKNHVHNVLDKLQVHRRSDAARLLLVPPR